MTGTDTMEIRQLARQFAESELRPHVEAWDHDGVLDAGVLAQLAELGFFGMLVPESFGGMEFDLPTYVSALEEIAWGEPAVAITVALSSMVADAIARGGSDAQRREWLEKLASGSAIACVAQTDDAAPLNVTRNGAQWVLNGVKKWVTNARVAQLAAVQSAQGVFLVPTNTAGYHAGARANTLGLRPLEIADVNLQDVRVDADSLLGNATDVQGSVAAILGMAAIAVGIAQAALEHARDYANEREQFGQKLRDFEGLQFKLADMRTRTEAARALVQVVALEPSLAGAAMAKVFASENAMWVSTQAVQIYGGYGYMRDYPVEKLMRDAKATEMMAGVNETLRVTIARDLYE